jgi:RimJ/RimL family protein N-acetyltransferase
MKLAENKKFILRSVQKGDEFDIAKNINDKIIARNTATIPYPYKLKDAKKWIGEYLKKQKKKNPEETSFAIVIDGEVVGSIGIHKIVKNHKCEIGYWLARKHWGKGIMPEAVKIVTDYGFEKLKLRRIDAGVYSFNPPSMRVLEKNGYKLEGILKKDVKKGNKLFDKHVYAKISN